MDAQILKTRLEEFNIEPLGLNDLRGRPCEIQHSGAVLTQNIMDEAAKLPNATLSFNEASKGSPDAPNDVMDFVYKAEPGSMT